MRPAPRLNSGHNGRMPKIAAATVAENRELRRGALLVAAADLMQRSGAFTVAEVAREVGLSRSAVYEYYSSAAELISDVLIDELTAWSDELQRATSAARTPAERIDAWLHGVLAYVADGRHALLRAAGTIDLPPARRADMQRKHQALIAPLVDALGAAGHIDPVRTARYVWGVAEVAIARIENDEATVADETAALLSFIDAALAPASGER